MKRSGFKRPSWADLALKPHKDPRVDAGLKAAAKRLADGIDADILRMACEVAPSGRSYVHSMAEPKRARMAEVVAGIGAVVLERPKERPRRSKRYRQWVAALACSHCGRPGPSQAAHGDQGKGMQIKACDSTCWPACADRPGEAGCHSLFGASGELGRAVRRMLEESYAAAVRDRARTEGAYPKGWRED